MEESKIIHKNIKYNDVLLKNIIERDNFIVETNYEKLTRDTIIEYKCKCGVLNSKMFRYIYEHGGYCKECLKMNYNKKVKETNIKKFGKEYASQNIEIKEKIKKTVNEKFNVDYVLKSPNVIEKIKLKNKDKYGVENPFESKEIKNKIANTLKNKYGVKNIMELDITKEKIKNTNIKKYGVEWTMQSDIFLQKNKETCLKKYGVTSSLKSEEVRKKIINTNIQKYGVKCTLHTNENKIKVKETWLNKYKVEYPMQNVEIQQKSQKNSKKFKEYKMPSGDIRKVQGYEPFALDELINKYSEEDILTDRKDVGRIKYIYDNKCKYYFPDIKIISENKYIEVKSTWTYKIEKDKIHAKANACKEQGFNYEIWVYDKNREKQII